MDSGRRLGMMPPPPPSLSLASWLSAVQLAKQNSADLPLLPWLIGAWIDLTIYLFLFLLVQNRKDWIRQWKCKNSSIYSFWRKTENTDSANEKRKNEGWHEKISKGKGIQLLTSVRGLFVFYLFIYFFHFWDCAKTDHGADSDLFTQPFLTNPDAINNQKIHALENNKNTAAKFPPPPTTSNHERNNAFCHTESPPLPQTATEGFVRAACIYSFQPITRHLLHFHKMTKLIWFEMASYGRLNIHSAQRRFSPTHTQWLAASVKCEISGIR